MAARDAHAQQVGRRTIPPCSFPGGPRCVRELRKDSMAVAREYSKPDLSSTFTCNPRWQEIEATFLGNQSRLTARISLFASFASNSPPSTQDFFRDRVLGRSVARLYAVEFQKRRLHLARILATLDPANRPRNADDCDRFASADLPVRDEDPDLRYTAATCMVRGPCGTLNPNAPCMGYGECSQGYPKTFGPATRETTGTPLTDEAIADNARKNAASCLTTDGWRPTTSGWPANTTRTSTSEIVLPFRQRNTFTCTRLRVRAGPLPGSAPRSPSTEFPDI